MVATAIATTMSTIAMVPARYSRPDDHERCKPIGKSAEKMGKRKLAAAILGTAPGHHSGYQYGERTVDATFPMIGTSESRIMIATKATVMPIHTQGDAMK